MEGFLTTKQAAERLGVTAGRIRQMILSGQLPAVKVGRDNLIKASDLSLVDGRKVGRPPKMEPESQARGRKTGKQKRRNRPRMD